MQIRASQKEDITAIMRIYEKARAFMDRLAIRPSGVTDIRSRI